MKMLKVIIIGTCFSAILSAICAGHIALTSDTISDFGLKAKDFWWLAIIIGGIVGLIMGIIVGIIIIGLKLNPILGAIIGLSLVGIPMLFLNLTSQDKFDDNHIKFGIALIFIQTLTGTIVSLLLKDFK